MIQPLGKNIVIEKMPEEEKKGSLIVVSKDSDREPYKAFVLSIGDKVEIDVEIGNFVLAMPYSGTKIEQKDSQGKDTQLVIVNEDAILGKIVHRKNVYDGGQ